MKRSLTFILLLFLIIPNFFFYPTLVKAQEDPYAGLSSYLGDIHTHTLLSDGQNTQEFALDFAKNVAHLDFAVIIDHAWVEGREDEITPEEWEDFVNLNNNWNSPGEFVTLNAFEWNMNPFTEEDAPLGKFGHKNAYFLDKGAVFSPRRMIDGLKTNLYIEPQDWWEALADYEVVTIPHHVAAISKQWDSTPTYAGYYSSVTDWNYRHDQLQRLVEIYSKWGSGECEQCILNRTSEYQPELAPGDYFYQEGAFVQDALARGFRLGIVGGSDSHVSKPGGQNEPEYSKDYPEPPRRNATLIFSNAGLTGIWTDNLNREDIYQNLKSRRTFATSGCRTRVKFSADNYFMGEEYFTSSPPSFKVEVQAFDSSYQNPQPATITSVEIVKGQVGLTTPLPVVYHASECTGLTSCSFVWQETDFNHDAFYYLRVVQEEMAQDIIKADGSLRTIFTPHLAWSSPIWINYTPDEINYLGKPDYNPEKNLGFYIWKDNQTDWHIRWTGSKNDHFFAGTITSTQSFEQVQTFEFEETTDTINIGTNEISFEAKGNLFEDGIDFKNSGQVKFNLTIDRIKNDGLVFYGSNQEHIKTKPGDVNGDGIVDEIDYAGVITHFGEEGTPGTVIGDVYPLDNPDGVVDEIDYATIINFFGT